MALAPDGALLGGPSRATIGQAFGQFQSRLEPVRGLQNESLLNDEGNPCNSELFAHLARRTGLILDAA